jgi:alkylation response protein AidB-like acyl-CoA dehydrogenase
MSLVLNDEQQLLRDSARRFVERSYGIEDRRALAASEAGFSDDHWRTFAELGWLAVAVPEAHDGAGGGMSEIAVLMEAFGRGLVLEPFLSTAVIGTALFADVGSDEQCAAWLPAFAVGERRLALAVGEPQARYDLHDVTTRAEPADGGFRISGTKSVVYDAPAADVLVVAARTEGAPRDETGITAFLIDPASEGVELRSYPTIDGHRAAEVALHGVFASDAQILGPRDGALFALRRAVDRGCVALGAEAVGIMAMLIDMTRDYLKTRKQFGTTLERFQVLQHRLVDMAMAHQVSEALVFRVAGDFDAMDESERSRAAAAVKAQIGRAGRFVGQQAVQLHGGIGMTDELPLGHYFKRLSIIDTMYGDAAYQLRRFGDLKVRRSGNA